MNRARLAVRAASLAVLPALLALSGCGGDQDVEDATDAPASDRSSAPASACGELTDADVEGLTGVAVTHEEKDLPAGLSTCTFNGADGGSSAVVMVLLDPAADDLDELLESSTVGNEDEISTEDVEVPGAEAAQLVTDTAYGVTTTSLVATTGSGGYTVYGSGSTAVQEGEVAVAALTILLGGTSQAPEAAPAAHPCDLLTSEEVSQAVGSPVTSERGTLGRGSDSDLCSYEDAGGDVDVSMFELGRTAPLETVVGLQERSGSQVEEIDVDGLQAAYLVLKPDLTDSADLYVAAPGGTFGLNVRAEDADRSAVIARDLLPLIAS